MRVMGFDLGIHKLAYSVWDDDRLKHTNAYDASVISWKHWQLWYMHEHVGSLLRNFEPDLVVIEDVLIGNNRKYSLQLAQTLGAVLTAVGQEHEAMGWAEPILVNVGKWKKEVIGDGHASKEAVRNYLLERDSAYADLCGSDQDRFDAACIGYYGVILSDRAERLAESR